jgi:predicted ATPase
LRILATSREALRVAGEQRFRLPSLPVPAPAPDGARTASAAASYAAVARFARRAAASDRRFALTAMQTQRW